MDAHSGPSSSGGKCFIYLPVSSHASAPAFSSGAKRLIVGLTK
jgi:hypothetical protein